MIANHKMVEKYLYGSITAAQLYMHTENMFMVLKTFLTHLEIKVGKEMAICSVNSQCLSVLKGRV